jgi:hypothetical protein
MAEPTIKTMYHVEKFLPPECPNCRARFQRDGKDYSRLLGDIIDGKKTIRKTEGYYIIVCAHCENMTACWPLETYQLSDKAKAEALVRDKGFANLVEVQAVGNMARDIHAIIGKAPGIQFVECEPASDEPYVSE